MKTNKILIPIITALLLISTLALAGSELTDQRWLLDNETAVTNYYINISDGMTPLFFISPIGNVNIKSAADQGYPLYVNGQFRASGNVYTDSGFLFVGADSVSSPGFTWNNDPNTGIYNIAPSGIGLSVDAINIVTITNTSVGINTTTPDSNTAFHVEGGDVRFNGTGDAEGFYYNQTSGGVSVPIAVTINDDNNTGSGYQFTVINDNNNASSMLVGKRNGNMGSGNWTGIDFMTTNEVGESIIPSARIAVQQEDNNNRYGLMFFSNLQGGVLLEQARITGFGQLLINTSSNSGAVSWGSGQMLAPSQNAVSPSYSFTNDPDTGIYSNTENVIAVAAGGGDIFYVRTSDILLSGGINLNLNNGKLYGDDDVDQSLNLFATSNVGNVSSSISFTTGVANAMYIDGSGNVGIGTTNPSSSWGGNKVLAISGVTVPSLVLNSTSSNQEASVSSGGNGLYFDVGGHATALENNDIVFRTEETDAQFSPTEKVRITSGGNVGINVTSPTNTLNVEGTGNFTGAVVVDGLTANKNIIAEQASVYGNAIQADSALDGNPAGNLSANLYGSDGFWGIRTSTNNAYNLDVYNNGLPFAANTVTQAGFNGINTTVPTQLLDVHGDVNISSETNPRLNFAGGGYIYDNGTAVIIGHE